MIVSNSFPVPQPTPTHTRGSTPLLGQSPTQTRSMVVNTWVCHGTQAVSGHFDTCVSPLQHSRMVLWLEMWTHSPQQPVGPGRTLTLPSLYFSVLDAVCSCHPYGRGKKGLAPLSAILAQSLVFFSLLLCLSPPFCVYLQYSSQSFGPPRHVHRCGLGQPLTLYCESCVGRMRFASSQSPATAQQSPHILWGRVSVPSFFLQCPPFPSCSACESYTPRKRELRVSRALPCPTPLAGFGMALVPNPLRDM